MDCSARCAVLGTLCLLAGCFVLPPPLADEDPVDGAGGGWTGGGGGARGEGVLPPRPVCKSGQAPDTDGCAEIVGLALGDRSSCVHTSDRHWWCWGGNAEGELAVDEPGLFLPPRPVAAMAGAEAVAFAAHHGCVLRDGEVRCFGGNALGQLGDASDGGSEPRTIALPGPASLLSAAGSTSCAVVGSTPYCWGRALNGQAWKVDEQATYHAEPRAVGGLEGLVEVELIGNGVVYGCVSENGLTDVRCWGHNGEGHLGDPDIPSGPDGGIVNGLATPLRQLAVGPGSACALDRDGRVVCWGLWTWEDTTTIEPVPIPFDTGSKPVDSVVMGFRHACVLYGDGTVGCFGKSYYGTFGQLGTMVAPTAIPIAGIDDAVAIASGWSHVCALRASGTVACWGHNDGGQVDPGAIEEGIASPRPVVFPSP